MKRRYYQQGAIDASKTAAQQGINKQLIVIPVGGGKSVVIGAIAAEQLRKKPTARGIIVTHRKELGEQNAAKVRAIDPSLEHQIGIEKAESRCMPTDRVMMASVQTVGKKGLERIKSWSPMGDLKDIEFVLIDEAHHVPGGRTYQVLIEEILAENPNALIIGFTATPKRADGERLDAWFSKTVYEIELAELIRRKYLAPFHGWKIRTKSTLDKIDKRAGDFVTEQLAQAVDQSERNQLAVDIHLQKHRGEQAIAFCVNKEHARNVHSLFQAAGVNSACLTEDTPTEERDQIVADFKAQKLEVLCNVTIASEGFDCQYVKALYMLRPTRSPVLYVQLLGRGARLVVNPNPDDPEGEWLVDWTAKTHCDVYDFVDMKAEEMGVQTLGRTVGINAGYDSKGEDLFALKDKLDAASQAEPYLQLALLGARTKEEIDQLLQPHNPLQEIRAIRRLDDDIAKLNWVIYNDDEHWLLLTEGELVRLQKDALGQYILHMPQIETGKRSVKEQPEGALTPEEKKEISSHKTPAKSYRLQAEAFELAIMEAEGIVLDTVAQDKYLISKTAGWKKKGAKQPITEGQSRILHRFKIPEAQIRALTKTEASEMIDAIMVKEKILAHQGRLTFGQYRGAPAHLIGIYDRSYLQFLKEKQSTIWAKHKELLEAAINNDCLDWLAEYRPHLYKENIEAYRETYEAMHKSDAKQFRETLLFLLEEDPTNEWKIILQRKYEAKQAQQNQPAATAA